LRAELDLSLPAEKYIKDKKDLSLSLIDFLTTFLLILALLWGRAQDFNVC